MSDMKDTVTYPLSAVMGDDEDRIDQLERELVEAREQLRLCNVDQFTTAAELAETSKALRIAVGLLSTYPKLSSEHPEYTLEYILNIAAMKEGGK
jgi:hypothetical protein